MTYHACTAHGMGAGMGFTHWTSYRMSYVACTSRHNGDHGFNSEHSHDVWYVDDVSEDNAQAGFMVYFGAHVLVKRCTTRGDGVSVRKQASTDVSLQGGDLL